MSALIPVDRLFFNFDSCPEPLDKHGRATWAKLFELQAHIEITQLQRVLTELRAEDSTEPDAAWEGWREAAREYHARRRR